MFQLGLFPRALCPVHTVLRPARIKKKKLFLNYFLFLQNVIAVFVFSDSRCKNACKMLADLCPCFHQSLTKLCPDLVSFACWIVTKFCSFTGKRLGHSHSKLCPILCRLRTKLCPNFGHSHARLYPISFAPCPFPNQLEHSENVCKYVLLSSQFAGIHAGVLNPRRHPKCRQAS